MTGKHQIQGTLLGVEEGKARIKKEDGSVLEIPLEKLSEADQGLIKEAAGP